MLDIWEKYRFRTLGAVIQFPVEKRRKKVLVEKVDRIVSAEGRLLGPTFSYLGRYAIVVELFFEKETVDEEDEGFVHWHIGNVDRLDRAKRYVDLIFADVAEVFDPPEPWEAVLDRITVFAIDRSAIYQSTGVDPWADSVVYRKTTFEVE